MCPHTTASTSPRQPKVRRRLRHECLSLVQILESAFTYILRTDVFTRRLHHEIRVLHLQAGVCFNYPWKSFSASRIHIHKVITRLFNKCPVCQNTLFHDQPRGAPMGPPYSCCDRQPDLPNTPQPILLGKLNRVKYSRKASANIC